MMIVIDPGHGGRDPGACGNGLKEKDITLMIGQLVRAELEDYQVDVLMTRSEDIYVTLEERVRIANEKKADFFLSLHVNAGGGTGIESYCDVNAMARTIRYQRTIHDAIKMFVSPLPDRGRKIALNPRFYVLRYTNMPAILLECMFIDNQSDALCLASKVYLGGLAKAITAGIVGALEIQKVEPRVDPKTVWDPQGEINSLKERGIIMEDKKATTPVSWGEFATVLNRIMGKEECKCRP